MAINLIFIFAALIFYRPLSARSVQNHGVLVLPLYAWLVVLFSLLVN